MDRTPYRKPILTAAQMAVLMMALTLVSKFIGFIRDLVLANFFGTSYIVDAYVMAQNIPNILLGGIFSAVGTTYMPVFSEVTERRGKKAGIQFTNQMITLGICIALIGIVFGGLFSDQLITVFAGKFSAETAQLASFYLKVAFGYALFTCINSILSGYLQYHNQFLQPIIAGYAYNVGAIAVVVISGLTSHYYLAFGALVGYGLQALISIIAARHSLNYRFRPQFCFDENVKYATMLAVPVFIGSSVGSINNFVDKMLATGLPEGSMAALNYGYILVVVIISLSASIVGTLTYPKITKAITQKDWEGFNFLGKKSLAITLMFSVPISLGAVIFSEQVIQVLYERGSFGAESTAITGETFALYSLGLVFLALNALLTQIYYSMRDMKTPILCSAVGVLINIGLNFALVGSMAHRGLAVATSVAAAVNAIMLLIMMKKKYPQVKIFPGRSKMLRICVSSVIAVLVAVLVYQLVTLVWMPRVCYLGIAVIASVLVYLVLLKVLKVEEISILKELINRRVS